MKRVQLFTSGISEGEDYGVLRKCIHIGILDFVLFPQLEEYSSSYHFWEDHGRQMYTDKLEVHVLELPKLAQRDYLESDLLDWARFLGADCREEMERMAEKNEYLGKAYERLNQISADELKRLEYISREKAIRDFNYLMGENLRQGHAQGMTQGMAEGMRKGELLNVIRLTRIKKEKGMSAEACAEVLEEDLKRIRQMYQMMEQHPDWDETHICEELSGGLESGAENGDQDKRL